MKIFIVFKDVNLLLFAKNCLVHNASHIMYALSASKHDSAEKMINFLIDRMIFFVEDILHADPLMKSRDVKSSDFFPLIYSK